MSDSTSERRWPNEWRVLFYIFFFFWILLQPVFVRESSHFGWGFFPQIASIVLVPLILAALVGDFLICLVNAFSSKADSLPARLLKPAIPALLFGGSLYWLATRQHVFSDYLG